MTTLEKLKKAKEAITSIDKESLSEQLGEIHAAHVARIEQAELLIDQVYWALYGTLRPDRKGE